MLPREPRDLSSGNRGLSLLIPSLSTFQLLYRKTRTDNLTALVTENNWEAMLDFFLRKDDFAGMRHVEFRQSLSGTYLNSEGLPERKNYRLGSGTSLDLYPVQSLIVRFKVDVARYVDEIRYLNTYDTVSFSVKLSLQL